MSSSLDFGQDLKCIHTKHCTLFHYNKPTILILIKTLLNIYCVLINILLYIVFLDFPLPHDVITYLTNLSQYIS